MSKRRRPWPVRCARCRRFLDPSTRRSFCSFRCQLLSKVTIGRKDECWLWKPPPATNGYGQMAVGSGRVRSSHRLMWELANSRPIPRGRQLRHTCDVRRCCNPSHLLVGTAKDNMRDTIERGNFIYGENHCHAIRTNAQVTHMRRLVDAGMRMSDVARQFGVRPSYVWRIVNRKIWRYVA
jgi:hypothetical protein